MHYSDTNNAGYTAQKLLLKRGIPVADGRMLIADLRFFDETLGLFFHAANEEALCGVSTLIWQSK